MIANKIIKKHICYKITQETAYHALIVSNMTDALISCWHSPAASRIFGLQRKVIDRSNFEHALSERRKTKVY